MPLIVVTIQSEAPLKRLTLIVNIKLYSTNVHTMLLVEFSSHLAVCFPFAGLESAMGLLASRFPDTRNLLWLCGAKKLNIQKKLRT